MKNLGNILLVIGKGMTYLLTFPILGGIIFGFKGIIIGLLIGILLFAGQ